ncbi:dihydrofolate reductase family protein [Aquimarina gracilis]|uniref:Dihydrofolate reductase family protein n=1 Tax=Aquimarina gracilis TaxID=874422 RepID=A0ABU5ZXW3_9FLAO|nr:dihydrofolate reductase family protein [Aquimarina gracilis]MEB3346700.1 dihydrofolate reductase family protein [Aquimarina gracilis]
MTTSASKVTLHMVSSLDGFIAKKDDDVSWLQSTDNYGKGVTLSQEDIEKFIATIDCYVMGSKTYEHALKLGWPYGSMPVIVLTHRNLKADKKNVEFYSGDLDELINHQLKPKYKSIWMVGGAILAKDFIRAKLVDEIIVSIMPVILGDGILFFDYVEQESRLHLKDVTAYKDGMVELWYEVKKE